MELGQRLVDLFRRDLLIGASIQKNAVLPILVHLNDRVPRGAFQLSYKRNIHSALAERVEKGSTVRLAHASGMPYVSAGFCDGDGLVESLTSAVFLHGQPGYRLTWTDKVFHTVNFVQV